jgi:glycerate 2-kinase
MPGATSGSSVLVAPDKFKGSLPAHEVASSVAAGLRRSLPDLELDLCPVADGGDGTLDAAVSAGFRRVPVEVAGPTGRPVMAAYGERDGVALVELAEAVGLARLDRHALAPMTASTFGAGQLIDAAISAGNRKVVLAVGGSASTDGGAGLVQALGAELIGVDGQPLGRGGEMLARVDRVDLSTMNARVEGVGFVVASDVENPLLGPTGAAAVFGPQKGASPDEVAALEKGLASWAAVVTASTGVDAAERRGAGAAGGVGFGAIALLGASLVSGADLVLDMVRFAKRARRALLVITGEGSLDEQSLHGKAPLRVAAAARKAGVRTVAAVGRCTLPAGVLSAAGISRVYTLESVDPDIERSMTNASELLELLGEQIASAEFGLDGGGTSEAASPGWHGQG